MYSANNDEGSTPDQTVPGAGNKMMGKKPHRLSLGTLELIKGMSA